MVRDLRDRVGVLDREKGRGAAGGPDEWAFELVGVFALFAAGHGQAAIALEGLARSSVPPADTTGTIRRMVHRPRFSRHLPHPWHGLRVGDDPPGVVNAFVEITPSDAIKYEVDKESGYLRVDRSQRTSSLPPVLYGFVPRTLCGGRVAALAEREGGRRVEEGDGDPLDVCVFSERTIGRAGVLVEARVIGGLTTLDGGKADQKIIAVMASDDLWGEARGVEDLPRPLLDRLTHYFATYKLDRRSGRQPVEVGELFDRERAYAVVRAAMADYEEAFGEVG